MLTLAKRTNGESRRISPAQSVTLRPEVKDWLIREAARTRRSVSAILNELAEKEMQRQQRRSRGAPARNAIQTTGDNLAGFKHDLDDLGDGLRDLRAAIASLPAPLVYARVLADNA